MANTTGKKFGGRQKGSLNKATKELNELTFGPNGPFKTLLKKMQNKNTKESVVIDCAKALLKYTNRAMPTEIEQENTHSFPTDIEINLVKGKK